MTMRLHVEFSTSPTSSHCAVKVQLRDGTWHTISEWKNTGRCLDVAQLDDVFACIGCELDIQQVLFGHS